ncbi:MAG: pyridoxamine 5'-phosphate oxidase family protein [Muribaculaceae bacterium]|nr:pyridoxamine 5'-phosphate oxidase family protein [Muribaculaceae bacterium]
MEREMRRFRQKLSENESLDILQKGKVAVLAVAEDNDYPYAVPLNYVYHNGDIYVHSASQGHKIDALKRNPKCSLCIVDKDDIIAEEFTSYFRSVIAFGEAEFITSEETKIMALRLLCEKYSPGVNPTDEINKSQQVVTIIRIRLEQITGKEAIELVRRRNL